MKKIFFAAVLVFIQSCDFGKATMQDARSCVEGYLTALSANDIEKADSFFTMNYAGGDQEDRIGKMKQMQNVLGTVQHFTLTDSLLTEAFGEPDEIILTYLVKRSKVTTKETFTVINDEGHHKISGLSVENQ